MGRLWGGRRIIVGIRNRKYRVGRLSPSRLNDLHDSVRPTLQIFRDDKESA